MFFTPAFLKDAKERRNLIKKIYYYRRNELSAPQLESLRGLSARFKESLAQKDRAGLQKLTQESAATLERLGGHYYKRYHLFENTETFVVAAIVAIGIRSFFLQPFKIPTNSMYPTYHGMVYHFNSPATPSRNALVSAARYLFGGLKRYRLVSPQTGEVRLPVTSQGFYYERVKGTLWGVIPIPQREYVFYVGQTPVSLRVPFEFSLDRLLLDKFFRKDTQSLRPDEKGLVSTGVYARAGEALLDFDLETGDMLFVDRFTYNFSPPQIGDPIVFRTRDIPGLTALNRGIPDDKYYIKRLVGLAGDTLSLEGSTLLRNGAPITGSAIFTKNSKKLAPYPGYQAAYELGVGATLKVGKNEFYAFGDNSPESLDSRAWGGVPQKEVVGKAVFIYYPFSRRWGFSE